MAPQADIIAAFLDADALRDKAADDLVSKLSEESLRSLWKAIGRRLMGDRPTLSTTFSIPVPHRQHGDGWLK